MAKTAKLKTKAPSLHSRAARRAASPSLNIDKSIKEITPPRHTQNSFFAVQNGGIKKRKNKPLSRQQKLRQQKGVERADVVKEQLENKFQKSMGKLKMVKERSKDWDDLNAKLEGQVKQGSFVALTELLDTRDPDGNIAIDANGDGTTTQNKKRTSKLANSDNDVTEEDLQRKAAAEIPLPLEEDDIL